MRKPTAACPRAVVLIACVLCLVCLAAVRPALAAEADKKPKEAKCEGFRDLDWGQKLADVRGMQFTYTHKGFDLHTRKTDHLKIGAAELHGIVYSFYKKQFVRVTITITSVYDMDTVKKILVAKYGEPKKAKIEHGEPTTWEWRPKDARITLTEGRKYQHGTVRPVLKMEYVPLLEQKKKDEQVGGSEDDL